MDKDFIYPDWPAPSHVKAFTTTRKGGLSKPPFDSFNLATHVDDDPASVEKNRQLLQHHLSGEPVWLTQTHTNKVLFLSQEPDHHISTKEPFDASFTSLSNLVCTVMTADCLPVLLTDTQGSFVAAVHAGWRGLASGIIGNVLKVIPQDKRTDVLAWLGPAIGPERFEVGDDVKNQFPDDHFTQTGEQKWLCDIYGIARQQLNTLGVNQVFGGDFCSYNDADNFYSYRRDGACGRMASCIWLDRKAKNL